mgnify:CR=1 FL=1
MTSFCISVGVIIGSFGHFKCSRCTYEVGITHVKRTGYVGTFVLPNITRAVRFSARCFGAIVNPAFSAENLGNTYELMVSSHATMKYDYLKIDASLLSNLYKNSSIVQPLAFQVLMIIKT